MSDRESLFASPCGVCAACVNGVPSECDAAERRARYAGLVKRERDVLDALAGDTVEGYDDD